MSLVVSCSLSTVAAGGSVFDDVPPEIIIPPSPTSCTESVDVSVMMECVANARSYICYCSHSVR